jgi:type VI protein secretion system component Hcp
MHREDGGRTVHAAASHRRFRVSRKIVLPAVAVLLVGGGVAVADIPSTTDGTITGCYATSEFNADELPIGTLRLIDAQAGESCLSGETPISWNQHGPPGQAGLSGPAGPQGAPGPSGPQGTAGGGTTQSGPVSDLFMYLSPKNNLGQLGVVPVDDAQKGGGTQAFALSGFSLSAQNSISIGSATTGAGAGKVQFGKFEVVKQVDKYSSPLFLDIAAGRALPEVQIIIRQPSGKKAMPEAQYILRQVVFTDIDVSGGRKSATETIQGEYGSIEFATYQTGSDGKTKVGSAGGWNQITNKPVTIPGLS